MGHVKCDTGCTAMRHYVNCDAGCTRIWRLLHVRCDAEYLNNHASMYALSAIIHDAAATLLGMAASGCVSTVGCKEMARWVPWTANYSSHTQAIRVHLRRAGPAAGRRSSSGSCEWVGNQEAAANTELQARMGTGAEGEPYAVAAPPLKTTHLRVSERD
jgi:hypothetical protein